MKKKSPPHSAGTSSCACQGAGPVLTELLQRLAPPEEARQHFETARLEFLKGLRAVIDHRISRQSKRRERGQSIRVE